MLFKDVSSVSVLLSVASPEISVWTLKHLCGECGFHVCGGNNRLTASGVKWFQEYNRRSNDPLLLVYFVAANHEIKQMLDFCLEQRTQNTILGLLIYNVDYFSL